MKLIVFSTCLLLAACDGTEPGPSSSGVAPDFVPTSPTVTTPAVELAEPLEPTLVATVEPTVTAPSPAPKISFEIDPLGRFEVITWDEAARRAEHKITPETAQATLRTLRQDLLGRRR